MFHCAAASSAVLTETVPSFLESLVTEMRKDSSMHASTHASSPSWGKGLT